MRREVSSNLNGLHLPKILRTKAGAHDAVPFSARDMVTAAVTIKAGGRDPAHSAREISPWPLNRALFVARACAIGAATGPP
jgi:hypothetical protein